MRNEVNIRIDDIVKNKNVSIFYKLNESANRLKREINENITLVGEFYFNMFSKNESSFYVHIKENGVITTHLLETSFLNKKVSREDYVKNKPKFYDYLTNAHILRMSLDLKNIFERNKEFIVIPKE